MFGQLGIWFFREGPKKSLGGERRTDSGGCFFKWLSACSVTGPATAGATFGQQLGHCSQCLRMWLAEGWHGSNHGPCAAQKGR